MSVKKSVKVMVRLRPALIDTEAIWVRVESEHILQTVNHFDTREVCQYEFDHCFNPETKQEVIFDTCVLPLLESAMNGQNLSIMAYGPTGAGKTHTIVGSDAEPGITSRVVHHMQEKIHNRPDCSMYYSYLEIYQEKVNDLLNTENQDLVIRSDGKKDTVVNLTEKKMVDPKLFLANIAEASKNRTTAATLLNERSSRSHSILVLKVVRHCTGTPGKVLTGHIYIVDLAGSEDNRRTGNIGVRLKESGKINTSLLALAQVVDALNSGGKVKPPYRDSKLTRLLKDALGGNSNSCMIVNLAPEQCHILDTFSALQLARKTRTIVNTVATNVTDLAATGNMVCLKRRAVAAATAFDQLSPKRSALFTRDDLSLTPQGVAQRRHLKEIVQQNTVIMQRINNIERALQQVKPTDSRVKEEPVTPVVSLSQHQLSMRQGIKLDEDDSPLMFTPRCLKRSVSTGSLTANKNTAIKSCTAVQLERNEQVLQLLNNADEKGLQKLNMVGPKNASSIAAYREQHGTFYSIDDLLPLLGTNSLKTFKRVQSKE